MKRDIETDEVGVHCGICSSELLPQEIKATEDIQEPRCVFCSGSKLGLSTSLSLNSRIFNTKLLLFKKKGRQEALYIYTGALGYLGYRRVGELNWLGKIRLFWILKNWKETPNEERDSG